MALIFNKQTAWRLVLLVQFVTVAAPLAILPFLSLYLQQLSGAGTRDIATWTAIAAGAPAITAIVSIPIWGRLAIIYPLGVLLAISCGLNALSILLQAQAGHVEIFALGRSLQGLTGIGVLLLIAVRHSPAGNGKSYSGLQQALAAGCIVGPLLGGWAFDHNSMASLLTWSAMLMIALGIFCGIAFHKSNPTTDAKHEGALPERLPVAFTRMLILSVSLVTAGAFGFIPFFADWAMERDGAFFTVSFIGLLHAGGWAAAFTILPLWGRWIDAGRERTVMGLSMVGSVLALVALLAGSTVMLISVSRIVFGAFYAGVAPSFFSLLGRSKHHITDLAAGRMAITLGQVTGPAICGLAVSAIGNNGALLAAATLTLLGLILLFLQPEARFHDID